MLVNASQQLLVPINSFEKIALRINQFFKFLIEFLGVRSDVLDASSFDMLLNFVPVFTVETQSLQK